MSASLVDLDEPKKATMLLKACQHGDAKRVRQCLEAGASADACDLDGDSALQLAAFNGKKDSRLEIVQLLLDAGALVAYDPARGVYRSPMYHAVKENSPQTCSRLLRAKASFSVEPAKPATRESGGKFTECLVHLALHASSSSGAEPECLALLLEAKASPDGYKDGTKTLSPILSAALTGQPAIAKLLLDAGARIDCDAGMELPNVGRSSSGGGGKMSVFDSVVKIISMESICAAETAPTRLKCLKLILDSDTRLRAEQESNVRAEATNEYVTTLTEMSVSGVHSVVEVLLAGGIDPDAHIRNRKGELCCSALIQCASSPTRIRTTTPLVYLLRQFVTSAERAARNTTQWCGCYLMGTRILSSQMPMVRPLCRFGRW